jgi:hypothetical protein
MSTLGTDATTLKTERLLAADYPKHPIAIEHTQVDENQGRRDQR